MGNVAMQLGSFAFTISTATYERLTQRDEFRWVTIERLANYTAQQFLGFGKTEITIEGAVFPLYSAAPAVNDISDWGGVYGVVGTKQIDALRAIGNTGAAQTLVDGRGYIFGQFAVTAIEEVQTAHIDNGAPRKQAYTITLVRVDNDRSTDGLTSQVTTASAADTTAFNSSQDLYAQNAFGSSTFQLNAVGNATGASAAGTASTAGVDPVNSQAIGTTTSQVNAASSGSLAATPVASGQQQPAGPTINGVPVTDTNNGYANLANGIMFGL